MTTRKPETGEYVTDITHDDDCPSKGNRHHLYLSRTIEQAQDVAPDPENEGEPISDWEEWEFEQVMEPLKLKCSGCWREQYVTTDRHNNVIRLTPDLCPREFLHNITRKTCEYCGESNASI